MIEAEILNKIYFYNLRSFVDNLLFECNISENDIVNLRKIVIKMQCDFAIWRGSHWEVTHAKYSKINPSQ